MAKASNSNYKVFNLVNGNVYISEIVEETKTSYTLKTPMLIEHKYNAENQPIFRYLPMQILSKDQTTEVLKSSVVMVVNPKVELLDAYQRICISFIPIEPDDEE